MPTFRCGEEKLCIEIKMCFLGQIFKYAYFRCKVGHFKPYGTQPQVAI